MEVSTAEAPPYLWRGQIVWKSIKRPLLPMNTQEPSIESRPREAGKPGPPHGIQLPSAPPPVKKQERPAQTAYELRTFDVIPRAQWNAFVDGCGEAWIYHRSSFVMDASRLNNARDKSFAVLQNNEIVAVCALFIRKFGFAPVLMGPGPAFSDTRKNKDIMNLCYARMEDLARDNDCVAIRIWRSSLAPANFGLRYVDTDVTNYGYGCGWWGEMLGFDTGYWTIVDLLLSKEEILANFDDHHRRYTRKAQKGGLTLQVFGGETITNDAWNEFCALHEETMARTSSGVIPDDGRAFLRQEIAEQRAILYSLYKGRECVASILLFVYKTGAYYEAGGASKLGLELRATVYLFYLAMCDLKARGIHYFNVGANIPSHRGTKWGTIGDFKRRFSTLRWDALVLERPINRDAYLWRLMVPLALRRRDCPRADI